MGIGVLIFTGFAAGFAQVVSQPLGCTVPARGDAGAALPETGAGQITGRLTDAVANSVVQLHADAGGRAHADGLPATHLHLHARLLQGDGHQLRLALLVPCGEQGVVDLQGSGAPVLAPVEQYLHAVRRGDTHARRRCFGRPDAPDSRPVKFLGTEFAQDGLGVGMALIQLGQCQVGAGDLGQGTPAGQGVAGAWQG
ncbi:hypothetical protein D9M72_528380 [compost metagenome]